MVKTLGAILLLLVAATANAQPRNYGAVPDPKPSRHTTLIIISPFVPVLPLPITRPFVIGGRSGVTVCSYITGVGLLCTR